MFLVLRLPAPIVNRLRRAFDGKAVCVTGGAGFIGGHIVDTLLTLGAAVRVIDDLSSSTAHHLAELIELEPRRLTFYHASILEEAALRQATARAQCVIHLAAIGSVPMSVKAPARSFAVNASGTLRVLEAARASGCARVVLAASSAAYGETPELPKREDMLPSPTSPYGASKLAAEQLCTAWTQTYGLDTVSLRYFNVFGPRQPANSAYAAVIPAFAARLLAGERPVIFGDGKQTRDFTHIANVVAATLLAAGRETPLAGSIINVGASARTSLLELAQLMAEAVDRSDLSPEFQPARAGDIAHSLADTTRAREMLGYEPIVDLATGLAETMRWYAREAKGAGTR